MKSEEAIDFSGKTLVMILFLGPALAVEDIHVSFASKAHNSMEKFLFWMSYLPFLIRICLNNICVKCNLF